MKIKINNQEIELKFGVRFVRELDKVAPMNAGGVSLGMSLSPAVLGLRSYDPVALSNTLYAASYTANNRPSLESIENYIETCPNIEKVFERVLKELQESTATKLATKNARA